MTTDQWKYIGRAWLMPVMLLATLGLLLGWWFQEAGRLDWIDGLGRVQLGILASLVAGLFTLVGGLPVLLFERASPIARLSKHWESATARWRGFSSVRS